MSDVSRHPNNIEYFNSLPTIEQVNILNYMQVLQRVDPALYAIRVALNETGLNPNVLPWIIRSISNLAIGTGYGKVQIFVEQYRISQIKGEESKQVNESIFIERQ